MIAYGSTQRSVGRKQASVREINPYETPFKPFLPSSAYALAASRHMHEFGTTREQMAAMAVAAREWALLNPAAWEKKPLTVEDVLAARMVSYPFTVRDCCLVTDGGGAIMVTSAERAKSLKKKPAYVLGCGQSTTHATISSMPDLTVTGALASGKAAYEMAKLGPSDVDAVELYDAFTINTILFLEDLGVCKKGEGGAFVSGGPSRQGRRARQHQRRRPVLLPPRHVRPVPADRGRAAAARRMRRATGQGLRGRHRPRQRRRAVVAGDGDSGHAGDGLTETCDAPPMAIAAMAHVNRVLRSINADDATLCVDLFVRPDGTFGFEEYRRDIEDGRGWFAIGFHASDEYQTADGALREALTRIAWLRAAIDRK